MGWVGDEQIIENHDKNEQKIIFIFTLQPQKVSAVTFCGCRGGENVGKTAAAADASVGHLSCRGQRLRSGTTTGPHRIVLRRMTICYVIVHPTTERCVQIKIIYLIYIALMYFFFNMCIFYIY